MTPLRETPTAVNPARPAWHRTRRVARGASNATVWTIAGIIGLAALLVIGTFFIDEPLRQRMEREMNRRLTGYTVVLPRAHFSLLGFSVTLNDLKIAQEANPGVPVAFVPRLRASLQWRELFRGHLVSDFEFDKPRVHLNRAQLRKERADSIPVDEHGWQEAALAVYPFKINLVRVDDADVVYIDEDPREPLHVTHLYFRASNIRNTRAEDEVYPSGLYAHGVVFDSGRVAVNGRVNFLAEERPGGEFTYTAENVPLDKLAPIADRANLRLKGGTLESHGNVTSTAAATVVDVKAVRLSGLRLDYLRGRTAAAKARATAFAHSITNRKGLVVRIDTLDITKSTLGMVNMGKSPAYRLFMSNARVHMTNYSKHFARGPAGATVRGAFMGSGPLAATARFRPETNGPDFDIDLAIEDTELASMNNMLRAYGKFDVTKGKFLFYSQLRAKNRQMTGYMKPLFTDVKVYSSKQDGDKNFFHQLYEMILTGVAKLLENRRTNEAATRANISGPVGDPNASVWQVIANAFDNAFVRAILPGFDRIVGRR